MAGIQLKVTPEVLRSKAEEISRQTANAQRNWENLCETVRASRYYWEGSAAENGRKLLDNMEEDVKAVFRRLGEHPPDLLAMAGVYADTEAKAAGLAQALPDDAIQ